MEGRKKETTCQFRATCHFFNIARMTPHSEHLKEMYCIEWPERCEIYQLKTQARPVPINLWPTGKI